MNTYTPLGGVGVVLGSVIGATVRALVGGGSALALGSAFGAAVGLVAGDITVEPGTPAMPHEAPNVGSAHGGEADATEAWRVTLLWCVVWLIANNAGDHEPLLLDPVNAWAATLILAIALDLSRAGGFRGEDEPYLNRGDRRADPRRREGRLAASVRRRALGDGLPQQPLEALYERLDAHKITVRDDCSRPATPLTYANRAVAAATATASSLFLGEIPPFPPLTACQELELALGVERGDSESAERLINANLRLVVSVVRRHGGYGGPVLDLIRAAILGLVKAVETFDWRLGHTFGAHATWRILDAVHRLERDPVTRPGARELAA